MEDKITCAICGQKMNMMTNTHLKRHNIKIDEYKKQYPNYPTINLSLQQKYSERSKKANQARKGKPRSQNVKEKIKTTKAQQDTIPWNAGLKMSEEYNRKVIRPAVKKREEKYKELGFHPKQGYKVSEETKQYLSRLNKEKWQPWLEYKDKLKRFNEIEKKFNKFLNYHNNAELSNVNVHSGWEEHLLQCECKKCGAFFYRTIQAFQDSKVRPDLCHCGRITNSKSKAELELLEFIRSIIPDVKVYSGNRSELDSPYTDRGKLEIDIYIPEKSLAIEFDGLYTHSEQMGKTSDYHITKRNLCSDKGITLIQVFEDEYIHRPEVVKDRLKYILGVSDSKKIGARKCSVKNITSKEANDFLQKYHLQGRGRSNYRYGLFYENELVSVMTFNNSNISRRNYSWEINRFCTKVGFLIPGAPSKMFKQFLEDVNPDKVITYADRRWGDGEFYKRLGFEKIKITQPNYWYINGNNRLSRFALRKPYNSELSERELRNQQGWNRIWDCGNVKYEWKNTQK